MGDMIDEGLIRDWFEEGYGQIEQIESNLLILEKDASSKEAVDEIFRAAHTLKGGSAVVHFDEISKFTHTLEDAMDQVRSGKVQVTSSMVDTLLDALDVIKNMIDERNSGSVYEEDYSGVVSELTKIIELQDSAEEVEQLPDENGETIAQADSTLGEYDLLEIENANQDNKPVYKIKVGFNENNPMKTVGGIQVFTSLRDIGMIIKTIPDFDELYSEEFYQEVVYIITSDAPADKIKSYAIIPDTTDKVEVIPVDMDSSRAVHQSQGEDSEEAVANVQDEPQASAPLTVVQEGDTILIHQEEIDALKKSEPEAGKPASSSREAEIDELARQITQDSLAGLEEEHKKMSAPPVKKAAPPKSQQVQSRPPKSEKARTKTEKKQISTSVLRVDSARIDDLLNLASEIVINKATFNQVNLQFTENLENLSYAANDFKEKIKTFSERIPQILEDLNQGKSINQIKKDIQNDFSSVVSNLDGFSLKYKGLIDRLKSTNQSLERISTSLREGVMRVRMVQIKQIFSRFPRLVRDLCRELRKDVDLVIEGEETEVDKAMIDDLIDPLIHIVRNAIDHGFETPGERESMGKNSTGILKLNAVNEGNLISIYISDDGKGIDPERVRLKAIKQGIIADDKVMRDQDVYNLLFEPGFSTAEKITSVSGRGVGLDVVMKNIEKLSGSIRVNSSLGKGTTFAIRLPLTLAIIQGLMIKVQDEKYAIPISSVLDSIRITPEDIKSIDNYEVINVREDVLSLLRLNRLFKLDEAEKSDYYYVVIVGVGDRKIGLLVDSLIGEEDIVIKPLKDKYTNTPGIAGATIGGDGTVSLILDVSQLIELGLKSEMKKAGNNKPGGLRV